MECTMRVVNLNVDCRTHPVYAQWDGEIKGKNKNGMKKTVRRFHGWLPTYSPLFVWDVVIYAKEFGVIDKFTLKGYKRDEALTPAFVDAHLKWPEGSRHGEKKKGMEHFMYRSQLAALKSVCSGDPIVRESQLVQKLEKRNVDLYKLMQRSFFHPLYYELSCIAVGDRALLTGEMAWGATQKHFEELATLQEPSDLWQFVDSNPFFQLSGDKVQLIMEKLEVHKRKRKAEVLESDPSAGTGGDETFAALDLYHRYLRSEKTFFYEHNVLESHAVLTRTGKDLWCRTSVYTRIKQSQASLQARLAATPHRVLEGYAEVEPVVRTQSALLLLVERQGRNEQEFLAQLYDTLAMHQIDHLVHSGYPALLGRISSFQVSAPVSPFDTTQSCGVHVFVDAQNMEEFPMRVSTQLVILVGDPRVNPESIFSRLWKQEGVGMRCTLSSPASACEVLAAWQQVFPKFPTNMPCEVVEFRPESEFHFPRGDGVMLTNDVMVYLKMKRDAKGEIRDRQRVRFRVDPLDPHAAWKVDVVKKVHPMRWDGGRDMGRVFIHERYTFDCCEMQGLEDHTLCCQQPRMLQSYGKMQVHHMEPQPCDLMWSSTVGLSNVVHLHLSKFTRPSDIYKALTMAQQKLVIYGDREVFQALLARKPHEQE